MKSSKLKLGTIAEEAAACRKAFEGFEVGGLVMHCHHYLIAERLREPAKSRISYILNTKDPQERALRLRLFRPVTEEVIERLSRKDSQIKEADAKLGTLIHFRVCKNCPWDGKTIFPKEK